MANKTVRVSQLKKGDVLASTEAEVVTSPWGDLSLPSKLVYIGLKYPGKEDSIRRTWNKNTTVKIKDQSI